MASGRTLQRLLVWLALCCAGHTVAARAQVTADDVQGRINAMVGDIRASQSADGSFGSNRWPAGYTGLAVLALRAAGVPPTDPAIRRAAAFLAERAARDGVYQVSLAIMALESIDRKLYADQIAEGARYLVKAQQASGGWSYETGGGTVDNSNSQFALLGLNAAAMSGVDIPLEVWQAARTYYAAGQNPDGGWSYRPRSGQSYGSMTAAGVASLYICDIWIHIANGRCGVYSDADRVVRGLDWMASNFSVTRNPRHDSWKFYYLYALERVGVILAQRYFGRHDWYREGVQHLVGDPPGMVFHRGEAMEDSWLQECYALLFLAKGNAPILIHKAQWGGRWNVHRYDAKFLTLQVQQLLHQTLDWQIIPLGSPAERLLASPILYVSGSGVAQWTNAEVTGLKEYIQSGGFVLVEAARGDQTFDRSFRRIVATQFPGETLEELEKDHPIYSAYYNLDPAKRPRLEAVKGPCWISILYAPEGLSCSWDVADTKDPEFELGVNIVAYATGFRTLQSKLVEPTVYRPVARHAEARKGAFTMGQIVHAGQWQPHKLAWGRVLAKVNEEAGLPVYTESLPIRLDVESPFQAQMLYLTGVREVQLDSQALKQLKLYLDRGGFLFAEAACGSRGFDESFRRLLRSPEMFPDQELRALPVGHPLYEGGRPLPTVDYSQSVRAASPNLTRPSLEYIEQDGRAVVVYSKYDISSAIDGHPCYACPSVLEPSASELALKIVLYGLSS